MKGKLSRIRKLADSGHTGALAELSRRGIIRAPVSTPEEVRASAKAGRTERKRRLNYPSSTR